MAKPPEYRPPLCCKTAKLALQQSHAATDRVSCSRIELTRSTQLENKKRMAANKYYNWPWANCNTMAAILGPPGFMWPPDSRVKLCFTATLRVADYGRPINPGPQTGAVNLWLTAFYISKRRWIHRRIAARTEGSVNPTVSY